MDRSHGPTPRKLVRDVECRCCCKPNREVECLHNRLRGSFREYVPAESNRDSEKRRKQRCTSENVGEVQAALYCRRAGGYLHRHPVGNSRTAGRRPKCGCIEERSIAASRYAWTIQREHRTPGELTGASCQGGAFIKYLPRLVGTKYSDTVQQIKGESQIMLGGQTCC